MKKLILTLGLLMCAGAAYGMDANLDEAIQKRDVREIAIRLNLMFTALRAAAIGRVADRAGANTVVSVINLGTTYQEVREEAIRYAIANANWAIIVQTLRGSHWETVRTLLVKTHSAYLNQDSKNDTSLLASLLINTTDAKEDVFVMTLNALISNKKLDLTATNKHGKLVCNDFILDNVHKHRLITLLVENNISNPFTQTIDADGDITFHLTTKARLWSTLKKHRLWLAAAGCVLAAIGIYKWYTSKKKATDDEGEEGAAADKESKETGEQIITS